jgi:undecaprenyl-diphosphatase
MEILKAIVIGILQGLTEFLPVSSSGHIELGQAILGLKTEEDLLFSIILHLATALSTIVIFWKDIIGLFKAIFRFKWDDDTKYIAKILVSMIPVLTVGLLFKDELESLFDDNILLVGFALLFTGVLLLLPRFLEKPPGRDITFKDAIIIGIAQAVAIIPGVSRSGSTIATALAIGNGREQAARFSFLMVLIPIFGAAILEFKDFIEKPAHAQADNSLLILVVGFVAAFLSGVFACKAMIKLVKAKKLNYFAYYCFVVGGIAILFTLFAT